MGPTLAPRAGQPGSGEPASLAGFGRADDPWRGPPQRRPDRAGGRRMANLGHSVG